ncbi:MAG: HlyD family efflux transporter periplasmic adaptor subunit [Deltaproteobacteria bacterium]|nr:HlyD family efflux transporter periplasmic adaptor subunit [Deltaproteobacteria bacterium]
MKRSKLILIILAAALATVAGYAYWNANGNHGAIVISGVIEADDIHVGSKLGGRVLKVVAKRGQTVKAGETLVLLEPKEIDASLAEAQAGLRQAEAKYALLTAGFRKEEIEQAEAAAKQAQAELDQLISGPRQQEIDQVAAEWKAAKAQAENAQKFLQRMEGLSKRELIAKQEYDDALAKADEAEQKMAAARERYNLLLAGTRPEEVERARQRWAEMDAKRRQLKSGFRKEEIAQAKSETEAARARVQLMYTQLEETVIKAPVDALVDTLDLEPGDLVGAGKPVATLLRIGSLWVRAYLPEARLGFVQPGLPVKVHVDSFPGKDFRGTVRRIFRQGEFTPRNVQTHEERALQVFQTEVVVDDPDNVLRPGMNADVTIEKR